MKDKAKVFVEEQSGQEVEFYSEQSNWFAFSDVKSRIVVVMWNVFTQGFEFAKPSAAMRRALGIH